MGKITPPPVVVHINSGEAVTTLDQLIAAQRAMADAARGITGDIKATTPEKRPRVCSQCGAPLHGHTCEYCGTEYNDNHENRKNDN